MRWRVRQLQVSGVLPASMAESSGARDWSATLALSGDLAGLAGVEVIGPDALAFGARLLPGLPALVLTPAAPVDFESLIADGRGPVLQFGLRFTFGDGEVVEDPTPRQVTVLDRDDTPPTGLAFASGGTVLAGAIGAVIGTLAVTDPDSTGPFHFSFPADDAWRFEVVGQVLKLRDGISLGLDDMPSRPLILEVSDGRQSAGFVLDLRVADPATRLADLPPGETRGGFQQVAPDTVLALRDSRTVARIEPLEGGERLVTLQEGPQVTLPPAQRVILADGMLDAGAESTGVQAAALHRALTGREADAGALAVLVARAEAGTAWTEIAAAVPATLPAGEAEAVAALYRNALGRDPGAEEAALQAGRLASGTARAQLAVDLALGAESLARQPAGGVWIADPPGEDGGWRRAPPGPALPDLPPAPTDLIWLL